MSAAAGRDGQHSAGQASAGQASSAVLPGRSFGEEGGLLTYGSYLRLPELLSQQRPQAAPPVHDELLFITVHQAYELWFKQLLHELGAARDDMARDETWRARHLLRRAHVIERLLVSQIDQRNIEVAGQQRCQQQQHHGAGSQAKAVIGVS